MSHEQTPAVVAEAVRCIREMSSRVALSKDEQAFVNELAGEMATIVQQRWAKHRYAARKQVRPCCMPLTLIIAIDIAHNLSKAGQGLDG